MFLPINGPLADAEEYLKSPLGFCKDKRSVTKQYLPKHFACRWIACRFLIIGIITTGSKPRCVLIVLGGP